MSPKTMIAVLSAASLVFGGAGSAASATPAEVAAEWGLIGKWATDCDSSNRGSVIAYEIADGGRLIYRRPNIVGDANEVVRARRSSDGSLILWIKLSGGTRENAVVAGEDGTIRSVYNRGEDGTYTIRDGRFVANGNATAPLRRCR
jgi:hypothetical protein